MNQEHVQSNSDDGVSSVFDLALVQCSIDNLSQGLSVVDSELRLAAWNQRYLKIFNYPAELVVVGRHISELIRFNAQRGLCGAGSPEQHVRKRIEWMQRGTAHRSERKYPDGTIIQIQGNPIPGGGFVMSFTDITELRRVEGQLKTVNEQLEQRVHERTAELEVLNGYLLDAKQHAEQANNSRSRFFAAISHDLMQPMQAARLFTSALVDTVSPGEVTADSLTQLVQQLDSSLVSAESILKDLQELSRLEMGMVTPALESFPLSELLTPLASEYGVMAEQYKVDFRLSGGDQIVRSDRILLRRILQNFVANAFRYASGGRVLLACRRTSEGVRIEVRDNGPGIPVQRQEEVFKAFQRLNASDAQGLGLGLAIARGSARLLGHELGLCSVEGRGSIFHVTVLLGQIARTVTPSHQVPQVRDRLSGLSVLCIDNDRMILDGLEALLKRWGCHVELASNGDSAVSVIADWQPDIILTDYRLDDNQLGVDVVNRVRELLGQDIPALVITADNSEVLKTRLRIEGLGYLSKPVKPAALRAYMNRMGLRS